MLEYTCVYKMCLSEQQFKNLYIKKKLKQSNNEVFCIETEETVQGFPDVMLLDSNNKAYFYEFKISDKNGNIKFQPTQPAFYRKHISMNVHVIAYNKATGCVHCFCTSALFDKTSVYQLSNKATINLYKVEKYYESTNSIS